MWKEKLVAFAEQYTHPAWGITHYTRVYNMCLELAKVENLIVNEDALFAAAYIHDIGAFEPFKSEGIDHSVASLHNYGALLQDMGFPTKDIPLVGEIIKGHMFYSKPAHTPECRVFHDADTLDFLGAIGIARMISIVGNDDWTPTLKHAIDVITQFRTDLPRSLIYNSSKAISIKRQKEMDDFLLQLSEATHSFKWV